MGVPGFGPYSASRAAVRSFARTWAAEFKDRGIRGNTLIPGLIDTPILLASSDSSFVTGIDLVADGGMTRL